jgi:sarcosine oxidase subunit gamma
MDKPATAMDFDELNVARDGFHVAEETRLGLIRLQVFHRKLQAVENLSEGLEISLPGPGEIVTTQGMQWFWSAPGEWTIAVPAGTECEVVNSLQAKLDGLFIVLGVITDSRVVLELSGRCVREVLARGSTVDFHPSRFGAGQCLNTRFARLSVMLACPDGGDRILLFADRPVLTWLKRWLWTASVDC